MTMPRRWPEHDLIVRQYARKGRHWLANQTGRNPDAINAYALRHGLQVGDLPGYVRVSELAALTEQPVSVVWRRANAEGVICRLKADTADKGTMAALVPLAWADAYAEALGAQIAASRRAEIEGWVGVKQLAGMWGIAKSTILRNLNDPKRTLGPLLEGKRIARGHGPNANGVWLMHPDDARMIAERLEADRQAAKTLVSTKSLAVEAGVKQSYAADIARHEFGGELLFVRGRLMCHVTPQAAEVMRQRFREGITPGKVRGRPRKRPELRRAA